MGRPPRETRDTRLRLPVELAKFIDLFQARHLEIHRSEISQHEALLTLIRRGLMASPEMDIPAPAPEEG